MSDYQLPTLPESTAEDALIERAATAILDEWNRTYALNPDVMLQAGESFKRRLYAEVTIRTLASEGWHPSTDAALAVCKRMLYGWRPSVTHRWWFRETPADAAVREDMTDEEAAFIDEAYRHA